MPAQPCDGSVLKWPQTSSRPAALRADGASCTPRPSPNCIMNSLRSSSKEVKLVGWLQVRPCVSERMKNVPALTPRLEQAW